MYISGTNLLDRAAAFRIGTGGFLDSVTPLPSGTYFVRINYPTPNLLKGIVYRAKYYYNGALQQIDYDIVIYKDITISGTIRYRLGKMVGIKLPSGTIACTLKLNNGKIGGFDFDA